MLSCTRMSVPAHSRSRVPLPRILLVTCIAVSALLSVHGQQTSSASSLSREAGASLPTLWITARNRDGSAAQLSATELEIKIDGKAAQVSNLGRVSPALRYCLLVDNSGSTRPNLHAQHDEAVGLLSKIPQAGRDYGLVVDFNDEAYIDARGTDPQKLIKGIQQAARGGTAMYDAMVACTDELSKGGSDTVLRLMFVLSDGEDNASHMSREATERTLSSARVRVYSIGEEGSANGNATHGVGNLKHLAEMTGGRDYLPRKEWTLDKILADISSDLAGLYAVTLNPDRPLASDRLHKLEVKSSRKDVAITAPRQYFVPSQ